MVNLAAFYERPDERDAREAWVTTSGRRMRQGDRGAYVNFLPDDGEASGFAPPTRARRGTGWPTIKRRYDPTNLFRLNQNIPPSA